MMIKIRKAKLEERSVIRQLAIAIWPQTYGHLLSAVQIDYMLELFYSEDALQKDFEKPGYYFFIINVGGGDAGYAGVEQKTEEHWHLHKLYLSSQHQGLGLGKKLILHVENFAADCGAKYLTLDVNRHNKARHFYEACGYKIVEGKDTDIGNNFWMKDYVMNKVLVS